MSNIITFYSYKGGVGRSMCLANIAVLLAKWGHKILVVDWDLEAPGLEHFFKDFIDVSLVSQKIGVIDLLQRRSESRWQDGLIPIRISDADEPLHFLSSGMRNETYFKEVRDLNIDKFYESGGGKLIEDLRDQWKQAYDFVLIDSRTGVTEIGGICTVHLPDLVILLFTATNQGFNGTLDIARRALKAQQSLPFDRPKLIFIPILTKFDTQAEFKLSQQWINDFADKLDPIYSDWLPLSLKKQNFIEATKIPYITYFSFGENLPVLEQSLNDPSGLSYSYENLAAIIGNKVNNTEELIISRDKFIDRARKINRQLSDSKIEISKALKIFISSAKEDRVIKIELSNYLGLLSKKFNLLIWSAEDLPAGHRWDQEIENNLLNSDMILALISHDYLSGSTTLFELNMSLKMNRTIIPIILDRTDLFRENEVSNFVALPKSGKALWQLENRDDEYMAIVDELEKSIRLLSSKSVSEQSKFDAYRKLESTKIHVVNTNFNLSMDSEEILSSGEGIFSIWAFVSDAHIQMYSQPRNMYLISYATNDGKELNNPVLAQYPNAWAILRVTPTPVNPYGIWRFWSNNINKDSNSLDFTESLSGGWHLFSIAWSSDANYIKFLVDTSIVSETEFGRWPSDFSKSMVFGTWPSRSKDHYFESRLGPWRFLPVAYRKSLVDNYFELKPETHKARNHKQPTEHSSNISIVILSATYEWTGGQKDVTSKIKELVLQGFRSLIVDPSTFGIQDPARGIMKTLKIHCKINGEENVMTEVDGNKIHFN